MKLKRAMAMILVTVFIVMSLAGCGSTKVEYNKLEDFQNATLGVVTGSIYDGYSREMFPNSEISYFKNFAELLQALNQGKVDGCMLDEPNFSSIRRVDTHLSCFDVPQYHVEIGYAFQINEEGNKIQSQMNELIAELKKDGTMDELIEKWYGETEPSENLPVPDFSDNSIKINVAMDSTRKPFVYYLNGEYAGLESEVFYMFCERYDYQPEIENVSFASGIVGLNSEKYDVVVGGVYMTPERKETVIFSEPYMYADVVMVKADGGDAESLMTKLKTGFNKTFIEEGRWRMLAKGIETTLIITVLAAVLGTILGFGIYMLCRIFGRIAKRIVKVFMILTNGIPAVVILMILYYIVFGKSDISGVVVSVIAFSLIVAAFVCEKLTVAVNSIDNGQTEAALAMGFTENACFFSIILPQALKVFMPLYRAEMSALVKATAVVGYIAVQDLTQMSDIIRSNTYEALFPLFSSAAIYLILYFGIVELIGVLMKRLEPKNRDIEKILKGVKIK